MTNKVKEKIKNNEVPIGTFLMISNEDAAETLVDTGLDYAIVDTEHGPYDTQSMANTIRGLEIAGITPFVRVGDVTHKELQRCADLGAKGIIVPMMRTIEEHKKLVNLTKYAPIGDRGFATYRSNKHGTEFAKAESVAEFLKAANDSVMVLPQCETAEAVEIIDEVMALDGIDGIFIGPFDLSISLGVPLQFESEVFLNAINKITSACRKVNKPIFMFAPTLGAAKAALEQGMDSITYTTDSDILASGYRKLIKKIKE